MVHTFHFPVLSVPSCLGRECGVREKSLTPTIATLKDSSFCILLKGSTCWWNTPYRNCLCKQLLSSFIYFIRDAGMIIDEYNKSFGYMHDLFWDHRWCLCQPDKSTGKLWEGVPCRPSSSLSVSSKSRNGGASVNAWNKGSGHAFVGPRQVHILWATKYRKLLPFPNSSQTSCSGDSVSANITANTNTSVSTVRISIS